MCCSLESLFLDISQFSVNMLNEFLISLWMQVTTLIYSIDLTSSIMAMFDFHLSELGDINVVFIALLSRKADSCDHVYVERPVRLVLAVADASFL